MSPELMQAKGLSVWVMSISLQVKVNGCLWEAFSVTDHWAQHFVPTTWPFRKQHGLAHCASVRVCVCVAKATEIKRGNVCMLALKGVIHFVWLL